VQVTILRDKKQQTITLQVDSKPRGALEFNNDFDDLFANGDAPELADLAPALDPDMMRALTAQAQADAEAAAARLREQADAMRQQLGTMRLQMSPELTSPEQMEQLRQQTEELRESMKNIQIDPKQMQHLQQQMEKFRKSFNEEQMERFKQQMEEWSEQSGGDFV
jgi:uncharacterized protein with von Willebrand factor type A (vWA) domain